MFADTAQLTPEILVVRHLQPQMLEHGLTPVIALITPEILAVPY